MKRMTIALALLALGGCVSSYGPNYAAKSPTAITLLGTADRRQQVENVAVIHCNENNLIPRLVSSGVAQYLDAGVTPVFSYRFECGAKPAGMVDTQAPQQIPSSITQPLAVVGDRGEVLVGTIVATLTSGSFSATNGAITCGGGYDPRTKDAAISFTTSCTDGRKGRGTATRDPSLQSGKGTMQLDNGKTASFIFGPNARYYLPMAAHD